MPCLNEERTIGPVIEKIQSVFKEHRIQGEIIVADNGSEDRSVEIATAKGAQVVHEVIRGYGYAYLKGFASARGKYFVMGDSDGTYDFGLIPLFLERMEKKGHDFVSGSRYLDGGDLEIPFLHRWIGNPVLTVLLNFLFDARYTDVYCGLRSFTREAYERIRPLSGGMEFNLELAINARLAGLKISEIPVHLAPRQGESKLNTVVDGWRSFRMILKKVRGKITYS